MAMILFLWSFFIFFNYLHGHNHHNQTEALRTQLPRVILPELHWIDQNVADPEYKDGLLSMQSTLTFSKSWGIQRVQWTTMVWQDAMQNKMAVPTFSEGQIIIMLQLQMRNIPNQATFYNISRNSETNNNTQYHTQRDCKHRTAFCSVRNKRSVRTMNGQKPTSHFLNTIRVSFSRRYCPLSFAPLSSSSSESSFQLSCTIAATFFSYSRLFSR